MNTHIALDAVTAYERRRAVCARVSRWLDDERARTHQSLHDVIGAVAERLQCSRYDVLHLLNPSRRSVPTQAVRMGLEVLTRGWVEGPIRAVEWR